MLTKLQDGGEISTDVYQQQWDSTESWAVFTGWEDIQWDRKETKSYCV